MSLIGRLVGKLLTKGSITLITPDNRRQTFGPGGGEHLTVRFTDNRVGFEIARNPRLGLGEAYMDGRLIVEDGTILDLLRMVVGANRWEDGGRGRKVLSKGKLIGRLRKLLASNGLKRARRNVEHHYDLKDELYETFLDVDRQYTAAYYRQPGASLEQAQRDKMAHIAAKLYLKPGLRVLEIGSGWGGFAVYLHKVAKVDVLGVTLSKEQLKAARELAEREGVSDHVKFELRDYRHVEGEFDRIVAVGMLEHVGLDHYDEFFGKCRDLLKPDGVLLVHCIGRLGGASAAPDPFTDKYIFPGYHVPALTELLPSCGKFRLIPSDIEILRLHYVPTLEAWLDRTTKARARIVEMYDERFFRMWEFYLAAGVVMFENGSGCNYQLQLIKDRRALPITRDYMLETEQKYRDLGTRPAPAPKKPRSAGRRKKELAPTAA
jgi:cyclopropane-fatty-acyl-phospholipid synthase